MATACVWVLAAARSAPCHAVAAALEARAAATATDTAITTPSAPVRCSIAHVDHDTPPPPRPVRVDAAVVAVSASDSDAPDQITRALVHLDALDRIKHAGVLVVYERDAAPAAPFETLMACAGGVPVQAVALETLQQHGARAAALDAVLARVQPSPPWLLSRALVGHSVETQAA